MLWSLLNGVAEPGDADCDDEEEEQQTSTVPADDVRRFINAGIIGFTSPISVDAPTQGLASNPMTGEGFKKKRERVSTVCSQCGGTNVENHGGATRETINHSAKYKRYCPDCNYKCLRNRDPNPDGSYTETPSNFALKGEALRCDYACGKCGFRPKKGHVCTGIAPPNQGTAILNAQSVLKKANTLIGYASTDDPLRLEIESVQEEVAEEDGEAEKEEEVQQPTPSGAAAAKEEQEESVVEESVEQEEVEQEEEESGNLTLLGLASKNIIQNAVVPRNGYVTFTILGLVRRKVKGDGSCWVYAMLECAGLLESAHPTTEQLPSPRDRGMDVICRQLAWLYLSKHTELLDRKEIDMLDEITDQMPQHPMVDDDDFGSYGTINPIRGLAAYLDVSVVCWNQKTLRNSLALQQVIVHEHNPTSPFDMCEHNMSLSEIVAFSRRDPRVMHIEWNGDNHYAALVTSTPTPINAEIKSGLLQVNPVTSVNPKFAIEAPKGYALFVNLFRRDIVLTPMPKKFTDVTITNKALSAMVAAAGSKYHGIALISKNSGERLRCFCTMSPGMYKASDFGKSGDFTVQLLVSQAFMKKYSTTTPPSDNGATCSCGIIYRFVKDMPEIQCMVCGVWEHAECAAAAMNDMSKLDDLDAFATDYKCRLCSV